MMKEKIKKKKNKGDDDSDGSIDGDEGEDDLTDGDGYHYVERIGVSNCLDLVFTRILRELCAPLF